MAAEAHSEALPRRAELDPDAQGAIGEQRARRPRGLTRRERISAVVLGGGFLVAAFATAALLPESTRDAPPLLTALLVAGYALAYRLDFEVGTGSAVPVQLVFVPMLFVVPVAYVPLLVAAGIVAGNLVDYARGTIHLERVFLRVVNAWHALGPALVLGIAGDGPPSLDRWPLYLVALAAQFVFDFGSAAVYERLAQGVAPTIQLQAMSLVWLVDATLASVGLAVAFAAVESPYGVLLALPLIVLLSVFARERQVRIDHALELSSAYRGTAFLLGDVVEADDAYTGSHSRDVVELTLAVADELGLDARARRDAEFAALLHDVGKVRTPKEIINKPGALTDEEREIIKQHTIEGERMLEKVGGLLGEIGHIVRSCHERYDGLGYPDGLAGDDIPLIARIVCCCDAFNAMTTDRPYRKALPLEEAVAELRANAGTQFDPDVAEAIVSVSARDN
ncbi:MAG TPA: HD-GYP domain-containing protein [Gaiellaceae bacterium]|jgi:putative nucleotidyltransferase with HDIG domain|nr:HD-GYP domain-containing protein [Gaiellaceae bacterium]